MHFVLRPFYNVLRQKIIFHEKQNMRRFEEIRTILTEQKSNTIPDPDQPFQASGCLALLQSHIETKNESYVNKLKTIHPI